MNEIALETNRYSTNQERILTSLQDKKNEGKEVNFISYRGDMSIYNWILSYFTNTSNSLEWYIPNSKNKIRINFEENNVIRSFLEEEKEIHIFFFYDINKPIQEANVIGIVPKSIGNKIWNSFNFSELNNKIEKLESQNTNSINLLTKKYEDRIHKLEDKKILDTWIEDL